MTTSIAYRYHSIEPDGLWTSEPFTALTTHHIRQGVTAGWLNGRPRWAVTLDGAFIYGLDAKGLELKAAPEQPVIVEGLPAHECSNPQCSSRTLCTACASNMDSDDEAAGNAALMKLRGVESKLVMKLDANGTGYTVKAVPVEPPDERPLTVADWQLIAKALEVYVEDHLVGDRDATQDDIDAAEAAEAKALARAAALQAGRVMP